MKNVIDQDYNNLESLSITADLWFSRAKDSYISCTGHYIDANFVFKHFTLACSPFPGEHSGESILNKLNSILTDWGIGERPEKPIPIYMVTDNAKNIQCAIKSNSQWTQINCMTHTLQLAINDAKVGLGNEKLLAKARKIVSHYNQSPKAYDRISKIQFQMGVVQHKLIQMVETRWNSEFYMLRRLVEQQQVVSADISKEGKIENLTTPEWALAGGLVEILEPLEIATRQLSQEASPTISLVIPMLFSIKHSLNN